MNLLGFFKKSSTDPEAKKFLDLLDQLNPRSIDDAENRNDVKEFLTLLALQGLLEDNIRKDVVSRAAALAISKDNSDLIKAFLILSIFKGTDRRADKALKKLISKSMLPNQEGVHNRWEKGRSSQPNKITAPEAPKGTKDTVSCPACSYSGPAHIFTRCCLRCPQCNRRVPVPGQPSTIVHRIGLGVAVFGSLAAASWIAVTQTSGNAQSHHHLAAVVFGLVVLPSWGIWLIFWEQRQMRAEAVRAQLGIVWPTPRGTKNSRSNQEASRRGRRLAITESSDVPAESTSDATPKALPETAVDTQGDYSRVKDPSGRTCGLWFRDRAVAENKGLLEALWAKLRLPNELFEAIQSGEYRVVDNKYDKSGGCFVMFGTAPAPGELAKSEKSAPSQARIAAASRTGISSTSSEEHLSTPHSQETRKLQSAPEVMDRAKRIYPPTWDPNHPARQEIDRAIAHAGSTVRFNVFTSSSIAETNSHDAETLVQLLDTALAKAPGDANLLIAKVAAQCLALQYKTAEQLLNSVLEIYPNHFTARFHKDHWDPMNMLFMQPTWSEGQKTIHPVLQRNSRNSRFVQLIQDSLIIGIAVVRNVSASQFPHGVRSAMRGKWEVIWSETPYGAVVAHYSLIEDNPKDPLKLEGFFPTCFPEEPDPSSSYWLLQRLATLDSCFLVLVDGERVLYNKRILFTPAFQNNLKSIAQKVSSNRTKFDLPTFQKAQDWHMKTFDMAQVKF